jgi:hypothetical protein
VQRSIQKERKKQLPYTVAGSVSVGSNFVTHKYLQYSD